ncbi:amino acid ABC transporter permease [Streptococcus dentiloxodontae]
MDYQFVWKCIKTALEYTPITLYISLAAFALGLLIGVPIALIRFYRLPFWSRLFEWLTNLSNSIPLLLTLTIVYLLTIPAVPAAGRLLGQKWSFENFPREWIAIAVLGIFAVNYVSEAIRASLLSVPENQWEAAASVGLSQRQTLFRIVLPQAFKASIPVFGNIITTLIKGSALVSAVSVVDLLNAVLIASQINYNYLEAYIAAAIVYWGICLLITFIFKQLSQLSFQGGFSHD